MAATSELFSIKPILYFNDQGVSLKFSCLYREESNKTFGWKLSKEVTSNGNYQITVIHGNAQSTDLRQLSLDGEKLQIF